MNDQTSKRSSNESVTAALKALIRGLTVGNRRDAYIAHKTLYHIGAPAIPHIQDAILGSSWAKIRHPHEIRHVTGLISVLHDIDETESRKTISQLISRGCAPSVAHIGQSISRFSVADFIQYKISGIPVLQQKGLLFAWQVRKRLKWWLSHITVHDLAGIERIYVLSDVGYEAWGTYSPIFNTLCIKWPRPISRRAWFKHFLTEHTFFHEVGHHVLGHVSTGPRDQQEEEADKYAAKMLAKSRP